MGLHVGVRLKNFKVVDSVRVRPFDGVVLVGVCRVVDVLILRLVRGATAFVNYVAFGSVYVVVFVCKMLVVAFYVVVIDVCRAPRAVVCRVAGCFCVCKVLLVGHFVFFHNNSPLKSFVLVLVCANRRNKCKNKRANKNFNQTKIVNVLKIFDKTIGLW